MIGAGNRHQQVSTCMCEVLGSVPRLSPERQRKKKEEEANVIGAHYRRWRLWKWAMAGVQGSRTGRLKVMLGLKASGARTC